MRILLALVLLILVTAWTLGPGRTVWAAQLEEFWNIRILAIDYDQGWLALRIDDFNTMVEAYNRQVDVIRKLQAGKGCT